MTAPTGKGVPLAILEADNAAGVGGFEFEARQSGFDRPRPKLRHVLSLVPSVLGAGASKIKVNQLKRSQG